MNNIYKAALIDLQTLVFAFYPKEPVLIKTARKVTRGGRPSSRKKVRATDSKIRESA